MKGERKNFHVSTTISFINVQSTKVSSKGEREKEEGRKRGREGDCQCGGGSGCDEERCIYIPTRIDFSPFILLWSKERDFFSPFLRKLCRCTVLLSDNMAHSVHQLKQIKLLFFLLLFLFSRFCLRFQFFSITSVMKFQTDFFFYLEFLSLTLSHSFALTHLLFCYWEDFKGEKLIH